ncbi:type II toxin-antitoxin system HicB family antitoxin [Haloferax marinum]
MISQTPPEYELTQDGNVWVAVHVDTGVASQGDTPTEAVKMAREAAKLHEQPHAPGDDNYQTEMLERFGIDKEDVTEGIDTPDGMP